MNVVRDEIETLWRGLHSRSTYHPYGSDECVESGGAVVLGGAWPSPAAPTVLDYS